MTGTRTEQFSVSTESHISTVLPPDFSVGCGETGQGRPVVLLHCSGANRNHWDRLDKAWSAIADKPRRMLCPELFGCGQTGRWPNRRPITLQDHVRLIAGMLTRVGEPVDLVGHSFGGAVALQFAHMFPERVRTLTLIEPSAFFLLRDDGPEADHLFAEAANLARVVRSGAMSGTRQARHDTMAFFMDYWNGAGKWAALPPPAQEAMAEMTDVIAQDIFAVFAEATRLPDYASITIPTLLVSGGRSPGPVCHIVRRLEATIPNARRVCIENAAHMIPLTHAGELAALLHELQAGTGRGAVPNWNFRPGRATGMVPPPTESRGGVHPMNAPLTEQRKTAAASGSPVERVRSLAAGFARRAADYDSHDRFAAENFAEIKAAGLLAAGVPAELGGGDASYRDMSELLREMAHHCSGTALALAMHTHPVMANVWRWRREKAPVEALLKRVATENLMLLSTGGNDWLNGSGNAEAVDGGYRISARKRFVSGAEAGDLLMTMAIHGDTVLHAGVSMKAEGVRIEQTWRTLGMRASGSQDVVLDKVFVPEAAISVKRPAGVWHPFFHLVSMVAFPLIYSVYRGVGERLRDEAVALASKRRLEGDAQLQVGAMEAALAAVVAAHEKMVDIADHATPGPETSARVMTLKRTMTDSLLALGNAALDAAGGSAFYRVNSVERLFRDLQAARYHPLTTLSQQRLAGRLALGLDADGRAA